MRKSLFFPEPMDALDHSNRELAGVKSIQMFLGVASDPRQADQLRFLASKGVALTLRIEEPSPGREVGSYYDPNARQEIMTRVRYVSALCPVEAVIIGNEPEHPYDLTWRSPNWGNNPEGYFQGPGGKASSHNSAVAAMTSLIKGLGIKAISPGWSHKRLRPQQAGQSGRSTWRELDLPAYNACDSNGAHLYSDALNSGVDDERFLWAFGIEVERCHRGIWINECNVNSGAPVDRMRAVVRMYQLIASHEDAGRVESFCPFVSNGRTDQSWSGMIMRDPECYRLFGAL